MNKLIIGLVFAMVVLMTALGPKMAEASGPRLVSLWTIKVSSKDTIGSLWSQMSSYHYTCRSDYYKESGGKLITKVVFWPNFMGPDTMVSTDTECVITNSVKGQALVQKWVSEPLLYRQLGSNFYEGHPDLIYAVQVRSFRQVDPKLVCKANTLGFYTTWWEQSNESVIEFKPRYEKAIFAPYQSVSGPWPHQIYASRDLVCTTNQVLINSWKRNRYWSWVNLPEMP